MFKDLIKFTGKPALFERGTANFWDDSHISKHLLAAHLNPDWDAASRRPETIDKTVQWIAANFLPEKGAILDLGCGPGLYAERFAQLGHKVTGLDFSRRSIEYAIGSRDEKGLDIEYIYQNYLTMEYCGQFDLVLLVYCDFGALTDCERDILLNKIYTALKPGGILVFDVFGEEFKDTIKEEQSWELVDHGFWAPGPHCVLSQSFHWPEEKVGLSQHIVLREDGSSDVYRIYDHYYAREDLVRLLDQAGFAQSNFHGDLIGSTNFAASPVLFVSAVKH